jgi:hypothetical protein
MNFNFNQYAALLCEVESNCQSVINSIGALGLYQFMPSTLNNLQRKYNLEEWRNSINFLSNLDLQEKYLRAYVKDTMDFIVANNLEQYLDKEVKGTMRFKGITARLNIYGMIAAAHLAGANNLKKFLTDGTNPNDGFTSLSDYAAFFSQNLRNSSNFIFLLAIIPAIVLYFT